MSKLNYNYDAERDVLTVEGIHYAGDMFREFGIRETHPSRLLRIVNRAGVLELKVAHDPELAIRFEQSLQAKQNGGSVIHRA